jgi:hypothetical protein
MAVTDQPELARKALAMREKGRSTDRPESEPHPDTGMIDQSRPDYAPSGAFDAEGHRPVLERSRKVR